MSKWKPGEGVWAPGARKAPGLGLRKGVLNLRTLDTISHIIVHHTGVGVLGRFKRDRDRFNWNAPMDAAEHVYTRIMKASGHYLIGYLGEVIQCVPDDFSAWHAGYGSKRRRGRLAEYFARLRFMRKQGTKLPRWLTSDRYRWWFEKWYLTKQYPSPTVWFPTLDVNGQSIGIELLSTPGKEPFPKTQIQGGPSGPGLVGLVTHLCGEYAIPLDEDHVLTHSDACPLSRTTKSGKPWDPPPEKYDFGSVFGTESAGQG